MKKYIATFYSHFGAIRYIRELRQIGINGKAMPVPRQLSSSCGTCVMFSSDKGYAEDKYGEIEQIVLIDDNGYNTIYHSDN